MQVDFDTSQQQMSLQQQYQEQKMSLQQQGKECYCGIRNPDLGVVVAEGEVDEQVRCPVITKSMVCFLEGKTFKADQVFGLDVFDSSLGAEQSISPLIVLEGNRLAAAVSPCSEQRSHSVCRIFVNPMMGV